MVTITIDGVDLFYRESGNGAPLLLIHGTGTNADIWGITFDDLAATHRVIAYDRRGYSRSASPPVKDLHRHVEDAAALLTRLQTVADAGHLMFFDQPSAFVKAVSSAAAGSPFPS